MSTPGKESIQLLCDGTEAFPEIISRIESARHTLEINMFIWRDDQIGKRIAQAVIEAANRGVKVTITKDRYGIGYEYGEEDQTSFFHENPGVSDLAMIRILEFLYNRDLFRKEKRGAKEPLAVIMKTHPNITVHDDVIRKDHSKFYIIDEEILILGGINIEDKENGKDRAGRTYRDYMIMMTGASYVRQFRDYRAGKPTEPRLFIGNIKAIQQFDMEVSFLNLIYQAKTNLTILMAYFSPVPSIMNALREALMRHVHIRILIPAKANFMNDYNFKTMSILYRYAKENESSLDIYLSPDMTHTKLVMSESMIIVGSCNLTQNAFDELDEMSVLHPNDDSAFAKRARESAEQLIHNAKHVNDIDDLSYNRFQAKLEGLVM